MPLAPCACAAAPGKQLQPAVLQLVGILELVHQNVAKPVLIVLTYRRIARQQLETTQQQLGKIDNPLALALGVVHAVDFHQLAVEIVVRFHFRVTQPLFLGAVDELLHLARRVLLVVDIRALQQTLDGRQLVGRIKNLEGLRQSGVAVMRAQQPVAQAVEGAYPHTPGIDGQHRTHARHHLARGLVGERYRQQSVRADLPGLDEPGHPRGKHPRLAAACACKHKRVAWLQGNGGELGGIEVVEQRHGRSVTKRDSGRQSSTVGPARYLADGLFTLPCTGSTGCDRPPTPPKSPTRRCGRAPG